MRSHVFDRDGSGWRVLGPRVWAWFPTYRAALWAVIRAALARLDALTKD